MASLAGVYAAHRLRIPIVLMEQNVVPGQAIRILSRYARLTQTGLPLQPRFADKWPSEILVTGTPVRPGIAQLAVDTQTKLSAERRPKLLILGGSQGSRTVNRLTLEALSDEKLLPSDWEIVHQTGEAHVAEVSAEYARRGRMASVKSFLPDLPNQLSSATIAISRAGASTLQELACAAVPSILIPLSHAANDHQLLNASLFFDQSAASMIDETSADAGLQLRRQIEHLVRNPPLQGQLSRSIGQFARPNAAREFASRIIELAQSSGR
jgi:UDP-N-acetylglucosamine--N-acetylmuramyl-(pentapeptide) pyrophosphoryl-undecaprenol N-acetylglucosamine transferase